MQLDEFIAKVCQRSLPNNGMAKIRTLAKELAEGAADNLWKTTIILMRSKEHARAYPHSETLRSYLSARWNDSHPDFTLLRDNGYLTADSGGKFKLSEKAFDLIEEIEPSTIFISYKRSESSAFALLVLTKLKIEGLDAFLDMTLVPGEDWHAGVKQRIQERDFFIVLLGEKTLHSEVVIKEIAWAIEAGQIIIPVWHNGFQYHSEVWKPKFTELLNEPDLVDKIDAVLRSNHSVRVLEESALGYNNAIVELLNRFGITP